MLNPHRRLRCENVPLIIHVADGEHRLDVSLAYDEHYILREIVFVGRGKIGHGLDEMLRELGIQLSRAIQGRAPDTGLMPTPPSKPVPSFAPVKYNPYPEEVRGPESLVLD